MDLANMVVLQQTLILYFIAINILAFILFGADKIKSVHKKQRIRERTLYILALVGGSAGALIAMSFFRHKTKKLSFQAIMAVILTLHILLVYIIVT